LTAVVFGGCDNGEYNGMPRALLDAESALRVDQPWPGGESWREASGTWRSLGA